MKRRKLFEGLSPAPTPQPNYKPKSVVTREIDGQTLAHSIKPDYSIVKQFIYHHGFELRYETDRWDYEAGRPTRFLKKTYATIPDISRDSILIYAQEGFRGNIHTTWINVELLRLVDLD